MVKNGRGDRDDQQEHKERNDPCGNRSSVTEGEIGIEQRDIPQGQLDPQQDLADHADGRRAADGRSDGIRSIASRTGLLQQIADSRGGIEILREEIQSGDILQQFDGALRTLFRLFRQHAHDQAGRGRGNGFDLRPGIGNGIGGHLLQDVEGAFARIRNFSGQHFIQRGAQTVNIGTDIHAVGVLRLFRSQIGRGTHHDVRSGQLNVFIGILRNTQIRQLDLAFPGQHDIVRLDVTVHDPLFRGGFQRFRGGPGDGQGMELAQMRDLSQHVADRSAIHIFHDDPAEGAFGILADVQDIDDIGIADGAGDPRLLHEALDELAALLIEDAGKDFQGAEHAQRLMPGQIHAAHAALPQLLHNDIPVDPVPGLRLIQTGPRGGGYGHRLHRRGLVHGGPAAGRGRHDHSSFGTFLRLLFVLFSGLPVRRSGGGRAVRSGHRDSGTGFFGCRAAPVRLVIRRDHGERRHFRPEILLIPVLVIFVHDLSSPMTPQEIPVSEGSSRQYCTRSRSRPLLHNSSVFQ